MMSMLDCYYDSSHLFVEEKLGTTGLGHLSKNSSFIKSFCLLPMKKLLTYFVNGPKKIVCLSQEKLDKDKHSKLLGNLEITAVNFLGHWSLVWCNHRHLSNKDCLMACTAFLVCFISTVNGHSKKKKRKKAKNVVL